jgi:hypothetical protein
MFSLWGSFRTVNAMTKLRKRIVTFLFFLAVPLFASAKLPATSLSDLVNSSDCIFVGEVIDVKDGGLSPEFGMPSMLAVINPVDTTTPVKGSLSSVITLRFVPGLSEEPSFVPKRKYVLFLKRNSSGLQVAVGYLGALLIADDLLSTEEIRGEPATQSVDALLTKVKQLVARKTK